MAVHVYTGIREVCDGFDVTTDIGVLHFASMPSDSDIDVVVASMTVPVESTPVVSITAEDGEIL